MRASHSCWPLVFFMMRRCRDETRPSIHRVDAQAKLLLIGIPVFSVDHAADLSSFLFSISPKESAFSGRLWPDHPTLHNFAVVFGQKHYFLSHFWLQLWARSSSQSPSA